MYLTLLLTRELVQRGALASVYVRQVSEAVEQGAEGAATGGQGFPMNKLLEIAVGLVTGIGGFLERSGAAGAGLRTATR